MVTCYDPDREIICDLGSEQFAAHAARARDEEREEEMRLAYVAVTRARLRAYLIWAELKPGRNLTSSFESPLGRVLFPEGGCSPESQEQTLRQWGRADYCQYRAIELDRLPRSYAPRLSDPDELQARSFSNQRLQTNRIRTSFSGLTLLAEHQGEETRKAGDEKSGEVSGERTLLPGGVRFGNLVHEVLETFDFADLGSAAIAREQVEKMVHRHRLDLDYRLLLKLLQNTVNTTLLERSESGHNFSLAMIDPAHTVREMEFTLHLNPIRTTLINDILESQQTVSSLSRRDLEGYLIGFIDLVAEYNGRYYVIDYKTNYLGDLDGYRREGLVQAMQSHNYGLQYWLYTLVVHRFLSNWVVDYNYGTHFGGVMYLFVRGMDPERPGSGVYFDRPEAATLMKLDDYFGTGSHGTE